MQNPRTLFALVPALLAFLAGGSAFAAEWLGEVVVKEGVPHVMNPKGASEGKATLKAEELWRLGGESEADEEFFGVINTVLTDKEGNVYLLDAQLSEIKVFSADGAYLRTIGREGEGPGEFRRPRGMFFLPTGEVAVLPGHGAVVTLTPEGDPGSPYTLAGVDPSGMMMFREAKSAGSLVFVEYNEMQRDPGKMQRTTILGSFDANGKAVSRYIEETNSVDFANPVFRESEMGVRSWAAGKEGALYLADASGKYSIRVFDASGKNVRVLEKDLEPRMRTAEEKDEWKSRIMIRGVPDPKIEALDYDPCIQRIFAREDGTLWVANSVANHDLPDGTIAVFDVFEPSGKLVREIAIQGEGDSEEDRLVFVSDRLYVVRRFADAMQAMMGGAEEDAEEEPVPIEVICYKLSGTPSLDSGE